MTCVEYPSSEKRFLQRIDEPKNLYARPLPINISTLMRSFPFDANCESLAFTSSRTKRRSTAESLRYDCGIDPIPASIGSQYSSKLSVVSSHVSRSTRASRNPASVSNLQAV
jgi:hypothetical protein